MRDLRLSNESNQAKLFDHSQRQGGFLVLQSIPPFYYHINLPGFSDPNSLIC